MKDGEHVKRDTKGRGDRKGRKKREKKKGKLKLVAVRFHQDQSTKTERARETRGQAVGSRCQQAGEKRVLVRTRVGVGKGKSGRKPRGEATGTG